ncbi:MAG: hypothetical protein KF768_14030 [Phycisphaeraceae bacterium]|nr:hypothetical protein [Phycisphaeraceae bacterium]
MSHHARQTRSRTALLTLALIALAAPAGCKKVHNDERIVGGTFSPPTITRSAVLDEEAAEAERTRISQPSVVSLDRENWPVTTFAVPNALPAHQPIYRTEHHNNPHTARNLGKFPTADSVNQTTNFDGQRQQVNEAIFAPAFAAADVALLLPRAIYKRPWFVRRGGPAGVPPQGYQRAPRGDLSLMPESAGEPNFPMTPNPPTWTAPTEPGQPTSPASPAEPAVPTNGAGATPAEDKPGNPAEHIGVGDRMGAPRRNGANK